METRNTRTYMQSFTLLTPYLIKLSSREEPRWPFVIDLSPSVTGEEMAAACSQAFASVSVTPGSETHYALCCRCCCMCVGTVKYVRFQNLWPTAVCQAHCIDMWSKTDIGSELGRQADFAHMHKSRLITRWMFMFIWTEWLRLSSALFELWRGSYFCNGL